MSTGIILRIIGELKELLERIIGNLKSIIDWSLMVVILSYLAVHLTNSLCVQV